MPEQTWMQVYGAFFRPLSQAETDDWDQEIEHCRTLPNVKPGEVVLAVRDLGDDWKSRYNPKVGDVINRIKKNRLDGGVGSAPEESFCHKCAGGWIYVRPKTGPYGTSQGWRKVAICCPYCDLGEHWLQKEYGRYIEKNRSVQETMLDEELERQRGEGSHLYRGFAQLPPEKPKEPGPVPTARGTKALQDAITRTERMVGGGTFLDDDEGI